MYFFYIKLCYKSTQVLQLTTASDRFSGHGYSGNNCFSGTKPSDDVILFTDSGITVIVKLATLTSQT